MAQRGRQRDTRERDTNEKVLRLRRSMALGVPVKAIRAAGAGSRVGMVRSLWIDPARNQSRKYAAGHSNLVATFEEGEELAVNSMAKVIVLFPQEDEDDGDG